MNSTTAPVTKNATQPSAYRRRIDISTRWLDNRCGEARVAIEDDHHHFRVSLFSLDGKVSEVASLTLRAPTIVCASAGARLNEIVGMTLAPICSATLAHTDPRQQCTHLIEMAGLGVAALVNGVAKRTYEAAVSDAVDGRRTARLLRNGCPALLWELDGIVVTFPEELAGSNIFKGFGSHLKSLSGDDAEAAMVLRRAIYTSSGRGMDLDAIDHANRPLLSGACWAWQPERADRAWRNIGSTWDFSDRPEVLTADDREWIAFAGDRATSERM